MARTPIRTTFSIATGRVKKVAFIAEAALAIWNERAKRFKVGRGGRPSRSKALAEMIDSFRKDREPIKHSWSYGEGIARRVVFDITPDRFEVLQDIRQTLSGVEGDDVGLGFAISALILRNAGSGPKAKEPSSRPRRSQAA